jgi:hypothetical protein
MREDIGCSFVVYLTTMNQFHRFTVIYIECYAKLVFMTVYIFI